MLSSVSERKESTKNLDDAVSMALRRIYELYGGDLEAFFREVSRLKHTSQPAEPRETFDISEQKLLNRKR